MTLEESKEVIPMMEAMITQIEEQQNIMAEMLQEIQEKDEKLMCFQEQEERLQQLEKELSELLQILPDTEELPSLQEGHPQKERVEKYAASFQKLADTFYGMPYRKDYLSSRQVEQIIEDTNAKVCSRCYQREICWGEHSQELVKGVEALVRSMESGNEENVRGIRADWTGICPRSVQYYETVAENFQKERQNLMWDNRMIENRLAVAQQLMEVSHIMENVASDLYDLERVTPQFEEELRKGLRKSHVILRRAWMMNKVKGRKQIFLTMRARSGQCISMTEIAQLLSKYCEISMVPVNGSRCIVNGEYHTVHFAEDVSYQVLYGTARLTREKEKVSGDNYICLLYTSDAADEL